MYYLFNKAIILRDAAKLTKIFSDLFAALAGKPQPASGQTPFPEDDGSAAVLPAELPKSPAVDVPQNEAFYHSLLLAFLVGMCPEVRADESGACGKADLTVILDRNTVLIIELEYAKDLGNNPKMAEKIPEKLARQALASIRTKNFGQRYRHQGKTVIEAGVGVFGRGQVKALFGED